MGRTSKPLRILVHPDLESWGELETLRSQGHTVTSSLECPGGTRVTLLDFDVVFGPNAWRMQGNLRKYLALAVKEARAARYGKKEET